jgi:hypothetical protein
MKEGSPASLDDARQVVSRRSERLGSGLEFPFKLVEP